MIFFNTKREKKYNRYSIFYMFVMIIYMAQATPETSRMVASLSGNPIPFLMPIVLTFILCSKNPITFNNKKLFIVIILYLIWAICSLVKYGIYTTEELSYHFFMIYAIIIAYIHNKVFGYKIVPIYENIMVFLCKIAVWLWAISVLVPASSFIFRLFPETTYGNSVLYLFTWMDPAKGQVYSGIIRNAGCSWEPGRFAIMISLAIFCNLCQYGVKFKRNKNIWWLLIALFTTQSTTGYFSVIVLYIVFLLNKLNIKNILFLLFVVAPITYGFMQLDFMGDKISSRLSNAKDLSRLEESFVWNTNKYAEGEYIGSLDRFDAMSFEWLNLLNDPILGYGRNIDHSYFRTNISTNYVLANGLVKVLSSFGLILGVIFFYILFISSIKIAKDSVVKRKMALLLILCLSAISYPILSIPVFTSFWFYGFFNIHSCEKLDIKKYSNT